MMKGLLNAKNYIDIILYYNTYKFLYIRRYTLKDIKMLFFKPLSHTFSKYNKYFFKLQDFDCKKSILIQIPQDFILLIAGRNLNNLLISKKDMCLIYP